MPVLACGLLPSETGAASSPSPTAALAAAYSYDSPATATTPTTKTRTDEQGARLDLWTPGLVRLVSGCGFATKAETGLVRDSDFASNAKAFEHYANMHAVSTGSAW